MIILLHFTYSNATFHPYNLIMFLEASDDVNFTVYRHKEAFSIFQML